MSSSQNYRLYSFVASLYLSELQKGLQTAHVVSNIYDSLNFLPDGAAYEASRKQKIYDDWASKDKTIIICAALNHGGVKACWAEIERINSALGLPASIFHEDEESMNGMATACGVIVPAKYYDVQFVDMNMDANAGPYWEYINPETQLSKRYPLTHAEGQFISHIKKYRLA